MTVEAAEVDTTTVTWWDPERSRANARAQLERIAERIPERYQWASFDHPMLPARVGLARPALDQARQQLPGRSVLLFGPTGSGKTSLAAALVTEVLDLAAAANEQRVQRGIEQGARRYPKWLPAEWRAFCLAKHARFVPAHALARSPLTTPLGVEPSLVARSRTASLLVLDDLGTDVTVDRSTAVRDVILARHDADLPTVVTTFFAHDDLVKHYGAGVARRLQDGVPCVTLSGAKR